MRTRKFKASGERWFGKDTYRGYLIEVFSVGGFLNTVVSKDEGYALSEEMKEGLKALMSEESIRKVKEEIDRKIEKGV